MPITKQIRIDSILGGHSVSTNFSTANQFRGSLGIDPSFPIKDSSQTATTLGASGLLRPTSSQKTSSTTLTNPPLWIKANPKDTNFYVYDSAGSAYTLNSGGTVTALSDAGHLSSSSGNGLEYYDNYMYFAKATDICRYGPLNGTPSFNGTYWTGTLGKSALTDTTLIRDTRTNAFNYPNHIMHRHSDGKLYIADVSYNNQGQIHKISTTKTSVEGDTDSASAYGVLTFGYGLWPTCIESYGSSLAIALFEGSVTGGIRQMPAKIAFWDTTSTNFNQITWVEFPDAVITSMKNINGVLYVFSSNTYMKGFRVSRFVGGYTFQEVAYIEQGQAPFQGAVDGTSKRLLVASAVNSPESSPCVISVEGLQSSQLSNGLFNVMRSTGSTTASATSLAISPRIFSGNVSDFGSYNPIIGWSAALNSNADNGIDIMGSTYNNAPPMWWSQTYKIGQPFKITKIRLPLAQAMASNMTITAKIYTDDGAGTTYTLTSIDNTNYSGKKNIVIRPENLTGDHNFWLELKWTGSALCVVGLPITIEYELLDD